MEGGCFSKWALDKATPLWRKHTGWGQGERDKDITGLCSRNGKKNQQHRRHRALGPSLGTAGLQPRHGAMLEPQFWPSPAPWHPEDSVDVQRGLSAKFSACSPGPAHFPACHRSWLECSGMGTCQGVWKCSLLIPNNRPKIFPKGRLSARGQLRFGQRQRLWSRAATSLGSQV